MGVLAFYSELLSFYCCQRKKSYPVYIGSVCDYDPPPAAKWSKNLFTQDRLNVCFPIIVTLNVVELCTRAYFATYCQLLCF